MKYFIGVMFLIFTTLVVGKEDMSHMCNLAIKSSGSVFYSNGQIMTRHAGEKGYTWYYPDGKVMTRHAGEKGYTWYYPNGKVVTYHAGEKGYTWYHSNGQVMTRSMGKRGATWFHSNGDIMTNSAPELSSDQLLFPMCFTYHQAGENDGRE